MTGQPAAIVEMVRAGEIVLTFDLSAQAASVLALLKKYADRGDFSDYRRNGRDLIPLIAPPARA